MHTCSNEYGSWITWSKDLIILNTLNRATVWSESVNFPASARHAFLFTLVRFIKHLHWDIEFYMHIGYTWKRNSMRIWHFKLRNIRRYAAYLGHWCLAKQSLWMKQKCSYHLFCFEFCDYPMLQHCPKYAIKQDSWCSYVSESLRNKEWHRIPMTGKRTLAWW